MSKKLLFILLFAVVLLGFGVAAYAIGSSMLPKEKPVTTSVVVQKKTTTVTKTGEPITVVGTMECLTPKSANGAQVESCAIGLKQDDGTSYALNAADPTTTGSIPTGQRVQVSGTLTQQSTTFDIAGIIQVTSIQRL